MYLLSNQSLSLFALIGLVLTVLFIAQRRLRKSRVVDVFKESRTSSSQNGVSSKHTTKNRPPGAWIPIDFKRPPVHPYPDWDIHTTKPLPYRPFRYGPYHVTMGLRSMKWDDWIELDNEYLKFHGEKATRIEERGAKCCKTAPEAFDGAVELLQELCDYLPQRYPKLFQRTSNGITNLITHEIFDIVQRPLAEDPMIMVGRLIQDDLALMIERPSTGTYHLLAGSILLPGFWRLEDKFGMSLSDIHTSGSVPQYQSKLEKGMLNLFRRLQPSAPVIRHNYFIQLDDNLGWSSTIGPEDHPDPHDHRTGWSHSSSGGPPPPPDINHIFFRSERQTLRRLPRSGAIVFTIRTYFIPVVDLAREEHVAGRLASAIRSWADDVATYKGKQRYEAVLLPYLDAVHHQAERERSGNMEESRYPF